MRILTVVASATGRTQRMAEAITAGAADEGAEAHLLSAGEASAEEVRNADALVLGSGVHMGGIESSMRAFLERTAPLWLQGELVGKLGAAFVSAGAGARGGAELALISLLAPLAEHGMLLVTMHNRMVGFPSAGCHWGPVAWTTPRAGEPGPTEQHLEACRAHGSHIARCTARWLAGRERAS